MRIRGKVRIDKKTKNLAKRLKPGDIAIIDHRDIDELAARSLLASKVKAVINLGQSISGRYPNQGPLLLVKSGVTLLDADSRRLVDMLSEGQVVEIQGSGIFLGEKQIATGTIHTVSSVTSQLKDSLGNYRNELTKFAKNTFDYAAREMDLLLDDLAVPPLPVDFNGRHALVVVRGHNYREDLGVIESYIRDVRPVLIGVDGGADALLDSGFKPHLIVGDMDSVSDAALKCNSTLIVHAYPDGRAPGMERLHQLGLTGHSIAAPGTSEDIAMLLAYQQGADLIVAVGSHSNVLDFLEKGRPGMASTMLTRMKIGPALVDAKGVSKLYRQQVKVGYVAQLMVAALVPITLIALAAPETFQIIRLMLIRLKFLFF
ncbi:putative cytokinetic ring protein SteA [Metallumcola ferriviriculae]|uniref:Cytokinetic ring protein SteA n=1 Tax=Metallumcola ferriviriculae TaxID=3039180 RepID=A0AAU0UT70_9FIRM|nr:putative cytokinetic ring protein SteA [Desulfitibacteraceae bacterium MK1]